MRKIDKIYRSEIERVITWLDSGLLRIKRAVLDEDLAKGFGGICCYDTSKEDYMIVITENQPEQRRQSAYLHELWHLVADDFSKKDVAEIEKTAHRMQGRCFFGVFDNYENILLQYLSAAPVSDMTEYKAQ